MESPGRIPWSPETWSPEAPAAAWTGLGARRSSVGSSGGSRTVRRAIEMADRRSGRHAGARSAPSGWCSGRPQTGAWRSTTRRHNRSGCWPSLLRHESRYGSVRLSQTHLRTQGPAAASRSPHPRLMNRIPSSTARRLLSPPARTPDPFHIDHPRITRPKDLQADPPPALVRSRARWSQ